jgi:hypothetical protein
LPNFAPTLAPAKVQRQSRWPRFIPNSLGFGKLLHRLAKTADWCKISMLVTALFDERITELHQLLPSNRFIVQDSVAGNRLI